MTGAPSLDLRESAPRAAMRWGACLVAVLLAHGAVAAALLYEPELQDAGAPLSPAILIDLSEPSSAAATIQEVSQLIPEPDMPEPPAPIRNPLLDMAPTPEPPPEVKIDVTIEIPPPEPPPPVDLKPPPPQPPKIVQKPPPPKPPEKVVARQAAPTSAPPSPAPPADRAAGAPAPSDMVKPNPRAIANWGDLLMAHLQRFKQYPPTARRLGLQGAPVVVFTVARNGTLLSVHLQKASGIDMLDTEAVELFRRASPLPAMPADVPGETFQYVMPVQFMLH